MCTPNNQKKNYRPKSAEPGSPLLRRALSPDRLHPRSAESKTSISPLVNTGVKVATPRVIIAQSVQSEAIEENSECSKETLDDEKAEKKPTNDQKNSAKLGHSISINISNVSLSNSTQLPRIAEEKDSPTGAKPEEPKSINESSSTADRSDPIEKSSDGK